jgi:hypothetical protein
VSLVVEDLLESHERKRRPVRARKWVGMIVRGDDDDDNISYFDDD